MTFLSNEIHCFSLHANCYKAKRMRAGDHYHQWMVVSPKNVIKVAKLTTESWK